MLKLGKLTDYGTVLMTELAAAPDRVHNAQELADRTGLRRPTVSKLLKTLMKGGLLVSVRGVNGGYRMARPPQQISVAQVIVALEGPIALTLCGEDKAQDRRRARCQREGHCLVSSGWKRINAAIARTLQSVSLAELAEREPVSPSAAIAVPIGLPALLDRSAAAHIGTQEA